MGGWAWAGTGVLDGDEGEVSASEARRVLRSVENIPARLEREKGVGEGKRTRKRLGWAGTLVFFLLWRGFAGRWNDVRFFKSFLKLFLCN